MRRALTVLTGLAMDNTATICGTPSSRRQSGSPSWSRGSASTSVDTVWRAVPTMWGVWRLHAVTFLNVVVERCHAGFNCGRFGSMSGRGPADSGRALGGPGRVLEG